MFLGLSSLRTSAWEASDRGDLFLFSRSLGRVPRYNQFIVPIICTYSEKSSGFLTVAQIIPSVLNIDLQFNTFRMTGTTCFTLCRRLFCIVNQRVRLLSSGSSSGFRIRYV